MDNQVREVGKTETTHDEEFPININRIRNMLLYKGDTSQFSQLDGVSAELMLQYQEKDK